MFAKKRKNDKLDQSKCTRCTVGSVGTNPEKIRVIVQLDNNYDFDTELYDTIEEINNKLNSDAEFITIGDLVLKRESIVSVIKILEEDKGGNKA